MRQFLVRSVVLLFVLLVPQLSAQQKAHGQLAHDMIHAEMNLVVSSVEQIGKRATTVYDASAYSAIALEAPAFLAPAYNAQAELASAPVEYTGVIVQGYTLSDELAAYWRTTSTSGQSSEWLSLYVTRSATDGAFLAGFPGSEVLTDPIQVLITTSDGTSPHIVVAGVFDKRLDEVDSDGHTKPLQKSNASSAPTTVVPPPLVTRADWNAGPFVGGSPSPLAPSGNYTNMTFHHAAGFTATTLEEGRVQVKAIQDFHQNGRGWSDIGYQFVIDRGGRVYQGRPFLDASTTLDVIPRLALGAHVGGANTNNIGICLLGCYHPPEGSNCVDQITAEALNSYVTMFAFLGEAYDIPIDNNSLKGHRDFSSTSCPGDNNYTLLPSIREKARQAQQFGNEIPDKSELAQNAPNPFSGETTIRYFLKDEGVVDLRVFDARGREVVQLVNEFQSEGRWHQVNFDASGLAAGVYLARIRVEGFSGEVLNQTKSLVHVD